MWWIDKENEHVSPDSYTFPPQVSLNATSSCTSHVRHLGILPGNGISIPPGPLKPSAPVAWACRMWRIPYRTAYASLAPARSRKQKINGSRD